MDRAKLSMFRFGSHRCREISRWDRTIGFPTRPRTGSDVARVEDTCRKIVDERSGSKEGGKEGGGGEGGEARRAVAGRLPVPDG